MTKLQKLLSAQFPDLNFNYDLSLAPKTYFKIGGPAEVYLELKDREQIIDFLSFCFREKIKVTLIGGASNIIVADEGVKGVVLRLLNEELELISEEKQGTVIRVDAGIKMSTLVAKTVDMGLTGLEYFLGVPGTLGGAVFNNAHYLSDLIGEHIKQVEVLNKKGEILWLEAKNCDFAYDSSRFHKSKEVILRVDFLLAKGDKEKSQELIKKSTLYRAETQPLGMPSSGCVFRNPVNTKKLKKLFPQFADKEFIPAGFLIDQAGLKGEREGDIEVSHKHAAFFVNLGNGTAAQIKSLIRKVKKKVKEKFKVELEEEVFYLK
ncbi:MAG: UDP-N-acetylmuramate dehydrogenase [Candidatus Woesebacteria bacterium]|jgi:UDP-N-acetylmuramate dehydrogenase